jgi:hypothetical protein
MRPLFWHVAAAGQSTDIQDGVKPELSEAMAQHVARAIQARASDELAHVRAMLGVHGLRHFGLPARLGLVEKALDRDDGTQTSAMITHLRWRGLGVRFRRMGMRELAEELRRGAIVIAHLDARKVFRARWDRAAFVAGAGLKGGAGRLTSASPECRRAPRQTPRLTPSPLLARLDQPA